MTSVRRLIVEDVVEALEKITVANGYENDLAAAAGGGGVWMWQAPDPKIRKYPLAFVSALSEALTHDFARVQQRDLRVEVSIWTVFDMEVATIEAITAPSGWDRLDTLISDVIKAVLVDTGRGVTGVTDTVVEGATITADTEQGGYLVARVPLVVRYRHRFGDQAVGV